MKKPDKFTQYHAVGMAVTIFAALLRKKCNHVDLVNTKLRKHLAVLRVMEDQLFNQSPISRRGPPKQKMHWQNYEDSKHPFCVPYRSARKTSPWRLTRDKKKIECGRCIRRMRGDSIL